MSYNTAGILQAFEALMQEESPALTTTIAAAMVSARNAGAVGFTVHIGNISPAYFQNVLIRRITYQQ